MSPKERQPETAVAKPIVSYLADLQWDVYQEIALGSRADIVGLQGRLIWVVEVKTTLTLDVIEQAQNWLDHAHYVSIAVPWSRSHRTMAQRVCKWLGIGMFEVERYSGFNSSELQKVRVAVPPKLGRSRIIPTFAERLRARCLPECKTYAEAGNADSRYYSPYRATCKAVADYLTTHGPSPVRDVVKGIDHHYANDASARGAIPTWAAKGKIPGVELDWSVRPALLTLSTKKAVA